LADADDEADATGADASPEPEPRDALAAEALLANNVFDTASLSAWLFESIEETVVAGPAGSSPAGSSSAWGGMDQPRPSVAAKTPPAPERPASVAAKLLLAGPGVEEPLGEEEDVEPALLQVHAGGNFSDDRDMIVIDEDKHHGVFLTQSGDELARRVEYQKLFSQLREG